MADNQAAADGKGFRGDMHRVGQGVETIKDDVANLARGTADAAASGMTELKSAAVQAADAAKQKLGEAQDAARQFSESVRKFVVGHPMASLGIAAGVGMLAGMVLLRPRS